MIPEIPNSSTQEGERTVDHRALHRLSRRSEYSTISSVSQIFPLLLKWSFPTSMGPLFLVSRITIIIFKRYKMEEALNAILIQGIHTSKLQRMNYLNIDFQRTKHSSTYHVTHCFGSFSLGIYTFLYHTSFFEGGFHKAVRILSTFQMLTMS